MITSQFILYIWENIDISLHHFVKAHKYILFARQTIPSTRQTAMARHHSFTSSQSEIKSTTTLQSHHPHPRPVHSRHILDDHHQPCALVVPKPARPSKEGAVRLEFEPVLWHSAQLLSTACGSCAEPPRCTTAAATVAATTGFQTATQGARLFRRIPFCQKRLVSNVLPG